MQRVSGVLIIMMLMLMLIFIILFVLSLFWLKSGLKPTENDDQDIRRPPVTRTMFGVLLDVSGSMQNAYKVDRSRDTSVQRTHAVLTTIANIVKREVARHERQEIIFTCAFGLRKPTSICDLVPLLEAMRDAYRGEPHDAYEALVKLAKEHNAPQSERWIRHHLTKLEAALLYHQLCRDKSLIPGMIEKMPSTGATVAANALSYVPFTDAIEKGLVQNSEAYKHAENIVAASFTTPNPKSLQEVSKLLDELLENNEIANVSDSVVPSSPADSNEFVHHGGFSHIMLGNQIIGLRRRGTSVGYFVDDVPSSSDSLHSRIQELVDSIEPYIYGRTPMCEALNNALSIFKDTGDDTAKVLFILSDGASTDGDPLPIAQELQAVGVKIITCYLTEEHIENPQCLFDVQPNDSSWNEGQSVLFEMSSTMKNTHTPVSYLVDAGWQLPPSGESRLFVRSNSLDVVNELCNVVVSQMENGCDALVDILEKVPLATYINQANSNFVPERQIGGTCYANAIAAVFHLAMQRIVGREGGVPDFNAIRKRIINEYGEHGADTESVLMNVCSEYRLHFREVDETGARKAINRRRPVVATFWLYDQEWAKFKQVFKKTRKGILKKSDLYTGMKKLYLYISACMHACYYALFILKKFVRKYI